MGKKLQIQALGGLEITLDDALVSEFDTQKVVAILVYLVCTGRTIPRDVLAEMFWEDRTQSQSLANLRVALTSLRQTVGEFVTITRKTVAINEEAAIWLDAAAFEEAVATGRLDEAAELYRGDFLSGFYIDSDAFEAWALRERERMRLQMQGALDTLTGRYLAQEDYTEGITCATRLLAMDNLRETTHRQLMLLLAQSGEREAALAQYDKLVALLDDELGIEPTAETQQLFEHIQSGQPLDAIIEESRPTTITAANPYKGLRAFQETDADDFFGRDDLVMRLLSRLTEESHFSRFLAVVGPSGSGKSSVVKAGLLPAIRKGALPEWAQWDIITIVPGTHPFEELDIALARLAGDPSLSLLDDLKRDDRGLLRVIRRILPDDNRDLLLVIDQFEELFTLVDDEHTIRLFLDSLYAAATDPNSPLRIIITLRADFYDRPLMHPDFAQMIRQRTEAIIPMTTEELERAVCGPVEGTGVTLESGLVTSIVSEVVEQPGALPLLQYALTELYDQHANGTMTLDAYEVIGGTLGALARRADAVYEALPEDDRAAARQVFLRLVTLGEGTEDIRRRAAHSEMIAVGGTPSQAVLDVFDRSRLLTFDQDPATGEPTVELAHEAIIREWGMLHSWLNESREDVRVQRMLARFVTEWQEANQDPGYLIHDSRLALFAEWAESSSVVLTEKEQHFLTASLTEEKRQQAQRRLIRRMAFTAITVVAIVLGAMAFLATDREQQAVQARATSEQNAIIAQSALEDAEREAEVRQSVALAASAQESLLSYNTDQAIALALEAYSIVDPPLEAERALFSAIYAPGTRFLLEGHEGSVNDMAISPDGRLAVSGGGAKRSYEVRGTLDFYDDPIRDYALRLWDLERGEEIRQFVGHEATVTTVSFSPDGQTIVSGDLDGIVLLWDVETGDILKLINNEVTVYKAMYTPDGQYIAIGGQFPIMKLWDIATEEFTYTYISDEGSECALRNVCDIAFSDDISTFALGYCSRGYGVGGFMSVWDYQSDQMQHCVKLEGYVRELDISPDGEHIAAATSISGEENFTINPVHSVIVEWSLPDMQETQRIFSGFYPITELEYHPNSRTIFAVSGNQMLKAWNLNTGEIVLSLTGHREMISSMVVHPTGHHVLTGAENGSIRYWDIHNGAELLRYEGQQGRIVTLGDADNGRTLASGGLNRSIYVWDTDSGALRHILYGHHGNVREIWQSPIDQSLVSVAMDTTLRFWDLDTGEELYSQPFFDEGPWEAKQTYDGQYIISVGEHASSLDTPTDTDVLLRDIHTQEILGVMRGHEAMVYSLNISPDRSTALTGSADGTVRLWDLNTFEDRCIFDGFQGSGSWAVTYGHDGRTALVGSGDKAIELLDLETCTRVRRYEGHSAIITEIGVSPNGQYMLSSSEDQTLILWDIETGERLRQFEGHERAVYQVFFLPDGQRAASAGEDGEIVLWRLWDTPEEIIAWGQENRYIRDLTCEEREIYGVDPLCSISGEPLPTNTPHPTPTASLVPTIIPTLDLTQVTATPTLTPYPTLTLTPTSTALPATNLPFDEPVRGSVASSGRQIFIFNGESGQEITVDTGYFLPYQGFTISLIAPDGTVIEEGNLAKIGPVTLPSTGTYTVVLESSLGSISYTLTLSEE